MTPDLFKEAEAIAFRLNLGRSDAVARRWAERDMRRFAARFVARAVRRALAACVYALPRRVSNAAARSSEDRVRDPERAAIQ